MEPLTKLLKIRMASEHQKESRLETECLKKVCVFLLLLSWSNFLRIKFFLSTSLFCLIVVLISLHPNSFPALVVFVFQFPFHEYPVLVDQVRPEVFFFPPFDPLSAVSNSTDSISSIVPILLLHNIGCILYSLEVILRLEVLRHAHRLGFCRLGYILVLMGYMLAILVLVGMASVWWRVLLGSLRLQFCQPIGCFPAILRK